jgi:hypothetical protein
MRLRNNIDYSIFLKEVAQCKGEVYYATTEGDRLNLKSVLSEFVFASYALSNPERLNGYIEFSEKADSTLLALFLEEDVDANASGT